MNLYGIYCSMNNIFHIKLLWFIATSEVNVALIPGRQDRTVDDVIMEVQQAKRLPELGQVSDMATIAMTTNSVLGKIEEENGG